MLLASANISSILIYIYHHYVFHSAITMHVKHTDSHLLSFIEQSKLHVSVLASEATWRESGYCSCPTAKTLTV